MPLHSGKVSQLTITPTMCIMQLTAASGVTSEAVVLKTDTENYNAMLSGILLAASNKYMIDLSAGSSTGVVFVRVWTG